MKIKIVILFSLFYLTSISQHLDDHSVLLKQVVLTGQYLPTHIDSSIYSVQTITKDELASFGSQNLSSVLSHQIGVDIFHDPFLGNYINFQGISGENIKVLIDGVGVTGLQNGSVDFSQINLGNIERIEVIEGPLSALYGNNAIGSTINLISKTNQNQKLNMSIESYFESIGQYNINGDIGYKINQNTVFVSLGRHYFDGWSPDDHISFLPLNYYADSTRFHSWKPKEQWFLKSSYIYKTKSNLIIKPYFDYLNEEVINKGFPQGAFSDYAFDEYYFTRKFDKGVVIKGPFFNRNIDIIFHHNRYSKIKNQYYKDLTDLSQFLTQDVDSTLINLFTHRVTCSNTNKERLHYQYGYSFNSELLNTQRIINNKQERTELSFFSSLDYNFNKTSIRTAFRYLYTNEHKDKFTPAVHIKMNLGKTYLRFSYAYGFRTPSLKEMYFNFVDMNHNIQGNTELIPEYSKNLQINLNSKITKDYNFHCKVFYNTINNFITLIQNDNTANFEYVNIGNYKTLGTKLGLIFSAGNANINFNIAYLGQSSIYNPDVNFHIALNNKIQYQLNAQNEIALFYSFKGSRSIISKNTFGEILADNLGSYNMLHISYNRNLNEWLDFSVGCNNIFDIQNLDSETLISSFHSSESGGVPLSCGRYIYTSLKINVQYD